MIQAKKNGLRVDIDRQEFALELKTWRLRKALSQQAVADRWGMSRYTIIRAERAMRLSWEMAYRCFNALTKELKQEIFDDPQQS